MTIPNTEVNLSELRVKYGKLYLLKLKDVELAGTIAFIFRPLTLSEYKEYRYIQLNKPQTWFLAEEEIFNKCLIKAYLPDAKIYNEDFLYEISKDSLAMQDYTVMDFLPAGVYSSVVNAIIYFSYPKSVNDWRMSLDLERQKQSIDIEYKLRTLVCTMFNYKPEETANFTVHSLIEKVVMAENAVNNRMELPVQIVTQEEVNQAKQLRERGKVSRSLTDQLEDDAIGLRGAAGMSYSDSDLKAKRGQRLDPKAIYEEQHGKR